MLSKIPCPVASPALHPWVGAVLSVFCSPSLLSSCEHAPVSGFRHWSTLYTPSPPPPHSHHQHHHTLYYNENCFQSIFLHSSMSFSTLGSLITFRSVTVPSAPPPHPHRINPSEMTPTLPPHFPCPAKVCLCLTDWLDTLAVVAMELQLSHLSSSTLMDLQTVNRNHRLHRYLHLRNKWCSTQAHTRPEHFVPVPRVALFLLAVYDERKNSDWGWSCLHWLFISSPCHLSPLLPPGLHPAEPV